MSRALLAAAMAGLLAGAAACSRSLPAADAPVIKLVAPSDGASYVEVTGLSASTLDALDDASFTPQEWGSVMRVGVADDGPPVLGSYGRHQDTLRFTPAFPFDVRPGSSVTGRVPPGKGRSKTAMAARRRGWGRTRRCGGWRRWTPGSPTRRS